MTSNAVIKSAVLSLCDKLDKADPDAIFSDPDLCTALAFLADHPIIDIAANLVHDHADDAPDDSCPVCKDLGADSCDSGCLPCTDCGKPGAYCDHNGYTSYCPACKTDKHVKSSGSTGGPDPYAIDHLTCGHKVIAMSADPADAYLVGGTK